LLLFLLIVVPYLDVSHRGINNATAEATLENQSRATLAQILGGVAIGIGLYYTWRRIAIAEEELKVTQDNLKVAQDNLKVTQENLEATQKVAQDNLKVAQEGQITERFTRAVDQLGNRAIEIRLGGIYALERIAHESKKDHWPIMEILTAYVRKNSPRKNWDIKVEEVDAQTKLSWVPATPLSLDENGKLKIEEVKILSKVKVPLDTTDKVSEDIQAILTVIRRRNSSYSHNKLDMQGTHLHKANLQGADLQEANLQEADLQEANLIGANLEEAGLEGANLLEAGLEDTILSMANLNRAYLKEAFLSRADLHWAWLEGANLQGAALQGANLEGTYLIRTILVGCDLIKANLEGADLKEANLEGAILMEANLKGAILMRANLKEVNLQGAYLTEAKGLTSDQLSKVKTLYKAELDPELEKPLREKFPALFDEPKDDP
jgi:uncharacterized protein YjbI with pentapeptide repeats